MLSIDDYTAAEKTALRELTYPAIRAFRPAAFNQVGFPTHIGEDAELHRYADIMNEMADREAYLSTEMYAKTEADRIQQIGNEVRVLTEQLFGRRIHPFMSLLRSVEMFRFIRFLSDRLLETPPRILEIGPGSGYLGALLLEDVQAYNAVENTQALYLWQNRLLGHLAGDDFAELATVTGPSLAHRVCHTPYWQFAQFHEQENKPQYDLVVCDRAFGEMDHWAVQYIVELSKVLLAESDLGVLVFTHIGEPAATTRSDLDAFFSAAGFRHFEFENERPVSKSTLNAYQVPTASDRLSDLNEMHRIVSPSDHGDGSELQSAREFLRLSEDELQASYDFLEFLGYQRDWRRHLR